MDRNCTTLQNSLLWCEGQTVMPGIRRDSFFTSKSSIAKFPTLPKDALGRPTDVKYTGAFEMVEGRVFHKVQHQADKAEFKSETQGEGYSQTVKIIATLVLAGVNEDAEKAFLYMLNNDNVFIVQDMEGRYRVIGSEYYRTVTTVSRDQGQGPTGTAGITIQIEASDIVDAPFYDGPIPTADGIINEAAQGD